MFPEMNKFNGLKYFKRVRVTLLRVQFENSYNFYLFCLIMFAVFYFFKIIEEHNCIMNVC